MHDEKTRLDDLKARLQTAVAEDVLPTLDEASTELAEQLGKRHEERLKMRERLLQGL